MTLSKFYQRLYSTRRNPLFQDKKRKFSTFCINFTLFSSAMMHDLQLEMRIVLKLFLLYLVLLKIASRRMGNWFGSNGTWRSAFPIKRTLTVRKSSRYSASAVLHLRRSRRYFSSRNSHASRAFIRDPWESPTDSGTTFPVLDSRQIREAANDPARAMHPVRGRARGIPEGAGPPHRLGYPWIFPLKTALRSVSEQGSHKEVRN